jgi:hypothetical protein
MDELEGNAAFVLWMKSWEGLILMIKKWNDRGR